MVKCNIDDRRLIVKVIDFIVDIATKYNPTKTNPYHGEMHSYLMIRLADWFNESYTGIETFNKLDLAMACACHDLMHSGKPDSESDNIRNAIRAAKPFVEIANMNGYQIDYDNVALIIAATEYPYTHFEQLSFEQKLIRDFDLMMVNFMDSSFCYEVIGQNYNHICSSNIIADMFKGLYRVMIDPSEQIIKNKQYFDFVNKLITFQQNVTFNVPYIQEVNSKYRNQSIELLKKSLID